MFDKETNKLVLYITIAILAVGVVGIVGARFLKKPVEAVVTAPEVAEPKTDDTAPVPPEEPEEPKKEEVKPDPEIEDEVIPESPKKRRHRRM